MMRLRDLLSTRKSRRDDEGTSEASGSAQVSSSNNRIDDDDNVVVYMGKKQEEKIPKSVTHATVHPSVRQIEDFAFQDCTSLVSVSIPKTVKHIQQFAFKGCTALKTLCLEEGLKSIERGAFEGCKSLVGTESSSDDDGTLSSLSIPSTVENIGWYAFSGNTSLANVFFNRGLKTIERGAFLSCELLVTVDLPAGLKTLSGQAFCWCEALKTVSVPSTVRVLEGEAFAGCKSLKNVHLHDGLQTIGERAFGMCESLVDIEIPNTVEVLEFFAFGSCSSLANVRLSKGLRVIGQSAFIRCTALYAIALPSSLEELCLKAFADCTNLRTVEFPKDAILIIGNNCFDGCKSLVNVSLPTSRGPANAVFAGCDLLEGCDFSGIQQRFIELPVHEACYHSSVITLPSLKRSLESIKILDDMVDSFGMTPFHIFAMSAYPRISVLDCLLKYFSVDLLEHKDVFEKTMLDYLLLHTSKDAMSLIELVLERAIRARICTRCCGNKWRSKLKDCLDTLKNGHDLETRRNQVHGFCGFCIRLEATSNVELVLWKMRMEEDDMEGGATTRNDCRYKCGSDVVVKNVIGYLWSGEATSDTALLTFRL